jgi:tetratricopeptide (TPR) repeat protein
MNLVPDPATEAQRLGDFEIVRELGRGGMGVVYEARQVSLNRRVALKVLSTGLGLTPNAVQRFQREAEAAAKLHHTNIVPVYATGDQDGTHYYAMELIEGPSLDHVIRQAREARNDRERAAGVTPAVSPSTPDLAATGPYVPQGTSESGPSALTASSLSSDSEFFDAVARMMAEVADALEYAHTQGVIHRDIKPSNLLLSPEGRLSVNDFGLARMLEQPRMTMTGEFVGTPAYMSPEQLAAGRTPLDHRTDIYSLGATLYELLTLQPPFTGERRDQVLAQILHKEPVRPRRVNKKIPVDLETICLKALEKDPDRRYQTAGQMAEDLRRYVNRFAIAARRAGPITRLRKWVRRRPAVAAALAFAVVTLLVAGGIAYRSHVREQEHRAERRQAAIEKAIVEAMSGNFDAAEEATRQAERLGASPGWVRLLHGRVALHRGDVPEAIEHLQQAVRLMPDSVAAHAMLVAARYHTGDFELAMEALEKVERLEPVTPEDFIFKGYAESFEDPPRGLATLDEAVRRRKSPLAMLMRSHARAINAWDTGKTTLAEQAVEDAAFARVMLGENPYALVTSLQAHLVAAVCYQRIKQTDKYEEHRTQAKRCVSELDPYRKRSFLREPCGWYFLLVGDAEAATAEWRYGAEQGNPALVFHYVAARYGHGGAGEALKWWGPPNAKEKGTWLEVCRVYVLADVEGREAAQKALAELTRRARDDPGPAYYPTIYYASIARLLGDNPQADDFCRQIRRSLRPHSVRQAFTQAMLDYNCGLLTERQFLDAAAGSHFLGCEAHFQVGLRRLAEGDRDAAREHFRTSVNTGFFPFFEYHWSRAFLARMDADRTWPPWIPVKKIER